MDSSSNLGMSGLSLTNQNTQTGISVSQTNYTRCRFQFTAIEHNAQGMSEEDSDTDTYGLLVTIKPTASTKAVSGINIDRYVSIGTDFTFFFFFK